MQQTPTTHAGDKRLNRMDRLADMGHFPAAVNAGATVNILLTIAMTWLLVPRWPQPWAPVAWIALVLAVNLSPVLLLRLTLRPDTHYPTLSTMNFVRDQHKFADWVYVAASANMAFWVLLCWALFAWSDRLLTLLIMLAIAGLATYSPVLLRGMRKPRAMTAT